LLPGGEIDIRRVPLLGVHNGETLSESPGLDELTPACVLGRLLYAVAGASFKPSSRTFETSENTDLPRSPSGLGLLDGRQATTHWAFYKVLEELGAKYVRKRWVEDGKLICSVGVSAGIGMALQLAARLTDEQTSREVQYRLGYDPEPPFGGIDYDHIGGQLGVWRTGVMLAAPVIAAKPKRLTRLTMRPSNFWELSSRALRQ